MSLKKIDVIFAWNFEANAKGTVVNEELQVKYDQHMKDKIETREERDKDRKLVKDTKAVMCFD